MRSFLLVASIALLPWSAHATVVVPKTVEAMAQEASVVARAVVLASQSAWDDDHRRIYTYTELQLRSAWVGSPQSPLVVRTLGGVVGSVGMRVSGSPQFEPSDEVVVFLADDPLESGHYVVLGMAQGKWRVEGELAVPDSHGLVFAADDGRGGWTVAHGEHGARSAPAMPLEALEARVRAARASAPSVPSPSVPAPPVAPPSVPGGPPPSPAVPLGPPSKTPLSPADRTGD